MTLRTRLVLITAGLCAVALLAANAAGVVLLRGYLMDQVDARFAESPGPALGEEPTARSYADSVDDSAGDPLLLDQRFGDSTRFFVYGPGGRLLAAVPEEPDAPGPGPALPGAAELAERAEDPFTVGSRGGGEGQWRVYVRPTGDGGLAVTATSLEDVAQTIDRLLLIDAAVTGVVLLLLGLGAAWVIRLGLRPLTRMEATAGHIAAGDFARRVPGTDARTEPGRLGLAMNAMLDRVESEITARRHSEQRLRRFLSDASHELRTPLTSIRGFAELSRRGGDGAEALGRIEAEARRMGVLVEDLLLLARLDEDPRLERRDVDLLELAAELVRDAHVQAPERRISLTGLGGDGREGEWPEPVSVEGDPLRLRQIISNLLSNALRHTPPEAHVTVRVGRDGDAAVVEVGDTGPGIPPEHAPHVFDRLYRAAPARERDGGGAGLGLSIAAALAAAHGGRIALRTAVGEGTTFRVVLPYSPTAPTACAAPRRRPG
ncbi:sensor histidine kinase [Streptomyces sp. 6N223]|uniref:sensor histidine kinase n=1 Tax=Streptomyces sp. 6N223 TaxID=3457412 RepID=UPI003FD51134